MSVSSKPPAEAGSPPLRTRGDLLDAVRAREPGLGAEDAFVVPSWFPQQRKWLEEPRGVESVVYNYPLLLRIRGPLSERALEESLRALVCRHGVLRSVFRIIDDSLVQVVLPSQAFSLGVVDLHGPPASRDQLVRDAAHADALRPLDLARGPVVRATLMRLAPEDHALLLTTHTLVFDDWSTGILIHELSGTYASFAGGDAPAQSPLPFQFGDFVRWQRERLKGDDLEAHLCFWRRQLASATAFEHLPPDFARPAQNSHSGARLTEVLPTALADALNLLGRQERVSLFMVLVAGFKCLLHRYSGHDDIGVGTCAANRQLVEVEGLLGRFGNSILLRTSLAGDPTFSELLKRVREVTLKASSHLELPFGMLLEEMSESSGRAKRPPFQVMFILQNAPKENWRLPGLSVDWVPLDVGTSKYDLIVWLKNEPVLEVSLEFSTQLFEPSTMARVLADYRATLEAMAKNPKERVGGLPIAARTDRPREIEAEAAPAPTHPAPSASVEATLVELWEGAFGIRPIDAAQNFFELGGDSLLAVRLLARINRVFDRSLPLTVLIEAPTIRQLAQVIGGKRSGSLSCLVSVQAGSARPPLFCVHGHGGEPFFCWELAAALGPDQPLYGLRSAGHCGEPAHRSVEEMAGHYVRLVRSVQPHGPYHFAGYCFGGMVAFEMARVLASQGEKVALLALLNTPAPGSLRGWPLSPRYIGNRVPHELKKLRSRAVLSRLRVLAVKSGRFARHVLGTLKTSVPTASGWPRPALSVADANVAAAKAYRPGSYAGPVVLFSTREVSAYYSVDPRTGWKAFAAGGIELQVAEGDNDTLFEPQFISGLAGRLRGCIDRRSGNAQAPSGAGQR